nr:ATP-binding cassette domain-containing protein [Nocardioides sp.]
GRVTVGGATPKGRRGLMEYRRRVAWMPQTVRAAAGLSVREQVALHGWLAGMNKKQAWGDALAALGRVALTDLADHKAAALSGGQRARMGLAQALVHDAELVLLDEPTAALDPDQKQSFVALLHEVAAGRNVVVSTHDASDLEATYDRVIVLSEGSVKFIGSTSEFLRPFDVEVSVVEAYRTAMEDC